MATVPGQILDLKNWYLTLPVGETKKPQLVYQPVLNTFSHPAHFCVASDPQFVKFSASANGVTTANTKNPRSELREMVGTKQAEWSTTTGVHTMTVTEKVIALPVGKPSVVIGQIHKGSDDLIEVRCWIPNGKSSPVIDVFHNSTNYGTLDKAYKLGTVYTYKIVARDGHIKVFYNDMSVPVLNIPSKCSTCFFKAGCYTQANLTVSGVKADAFGEVWMSQVKVEHA